MTDEQPGSKSCVARIAKGCGCLLGAAALFVIVTFLIMGTPDGGGLGGQEGRRSTCLSNLGRLGEALKQYMTDYDDCLPSSALVNHAKSWNAKDFEQFATRRGTLPPPQRPIAGSVTLHMVLYPYYGKWPRVTMCPYDSEAYAKDGPSSYCYKTALDKAWYGLGCSERHCSEASFDYPADTLVFYERLPFHFQSFLDAVKIKDSKLKAGLMNGSRINVLYLDGHVTMVHIQNATSGNPAKACVAPDGEPMYFNYDNSKGQLATGPAKYVDPARYSDHLEKEDPY